MFPPDLSAILKPADAEDLDEAAEKSTLELYNILQEGDEDDGT